MNWNRYIAAGLMAAFLMATAGAQKSDKAEVLFESARQKEMLEGNLESAIKQYKEVVAKYGSHRAVAAQALVRMGECYEKLGDAEARKAYERVVREFPEQAQPATMARERLAALVQAMTPAPAGGVTQRLMWSTVTWGWGGVSGDGRWVSFQGDQGDLTIRDLTTGQNRRLTGYGPWSKRPAESYGGAFSPDGKRVVYMWEVYQTNTEEVRVINVDGTGERLLYKNDKASHVFPWAWTPDGTAVAATVRLSDPDECQILLISTADESVKVLHAAKGSYFDSMAFSPAGRFLAFTERGDIYALDLQSPGGEKTPVSLVKHSADDQLMGWSPDGSHILFVSDRSGARDAWLLPVKAGKPAGEPRLVKSGLAMADDPWGGVSILPMGFTRTGTFFYGVELDTEDASIAVLDSASGRLEGPPVRFTERFNGSTMGPIWSPDGKWASYQHGQMLLLRNLDSGVERELHPQLLASRQTTWHPDGKSLIVIGASREKQRGVFRVDLDTGVATAILPDREGWRTSGAVFSSDGNMLYREEWRTQGGKLLLAQVVARDLRAGQEKVIHRTREKDQAPIRDMALSPDGKELASLNGRKKIYVFPVTGEDPQNLPLYSARGNVGEAFHAIAWHPDGKSVLASMNRYHATGELWRIPVGGGQPETWPLPFRSVELHVHPDGRRVGLTAWGHGNEVWALENFLPVVAK